jgi:DNA-binding NtrC family response regulator
MMDAIEIEPSPFEAYGWRSSSAAESPSRSHNQTQTILLVDDEAVIRSLAKMTLASHGYRVLVAEDGAEALNLIRSRPGEIDLVVLDLVMPGMSGPATLSELQKRKDSPDVLLSSGYTSDHLEPEQLRSVLGFLKKPYRPSHLLCAVRECLAERSRRERQSAI